MPIASLSTTAEKSLLHGRDKLEQEVEEGNVEYKSMMINLSEERFQQLMSQMKWRMTEGDGEALYEIGVDDSGVPIGLDPQEFDETLQNVERMAKELEADMTILCEKPVNGSGKRVAEVLLRRYSTDQYLDMRVAVCGNVDSGKCLAKDTPVMMYSGEVVPVQNVRLGDLLMGDDSTPRKVLLTSSGTGRLYSVKNTADSASYTVNGNHVLSLFDTEMGIAVDVPIRQYLDMSTEERIMRLRGYRTSVATFGGYSEDDEHNNIDPYVFGRVMRAHLEGRNRSNGRIDDDNPHWVHELQKQFSKERWWSSRQEEHQATVDEICELIVQQGCIPHPLKCGSLATRSDLFAGLLDSDMCSIIDKGHSHSDAIQGQGYEGEKGFVLRLSNRDRQIAEDVQFIGRSLGFVVTLVNDTNCIECHVANSNQARVSLGNNSGIISTSAIKVEDVGVGEFFGFQLDGNHRFLLGDFTVTHNSTLIGVLTKGQLDNGRGRARTSVFQHRHEVETGRTSSVSHQIVGFDSKGKIVNYDSVATHMDWKDIVCKSSKLITFIDLCGHEKYFKTTVTGMTGHSVDYACVVVGANMGVLKMTREHIGLCLALKVPMFFVVTKVDICPEHVLKNTLATIHKLLKMPGVRKLPYHIKNEDDVITCAKNISSDRIVPIFLISSVTGDKLDLVRQFLNLLPARKDWESKIDKPTEFVIDATFYVSGIGTVVSGTVQQGAIAVNDVLSLGPDGNGQFRQVQIKSIHAKRVNVKRVVAGQQVSCALRKVPRSSIRKGMVLVDNKAAKAVFEFTAEILVLSHSTLIKLNYQPVVHTGCCRQSCKIISMNKENLKTGEKAEVTFRFMFRPEYLKVGERLIFREGRTKGLGVITGLKD